MSRLMYISNLGKQIQYIEKAVTTYPELIQGEVDICNMKKQPLWDATFESRLRAADVVLVTNMGVGLDSPFLERLERWLYAHHPKYWIDVVEPKKTDILYRNIDVDQRTLLESYRRTSGVMNYVRLINGSFSTKPTSEWEKPDHIPWQAIMSSWMPKDIGIGRPSRCISIATNGLWGIFTISRPCLKRFINMVTTRLSFMGNMGLILGWAFRI